MLNCNKRKKVEFMGKTISTTIRISEELKQNLESLASKDSRSLNNLINIILQSYVNKQLDQKDIGKS